MYRKGADIVASCSPSAVINNLSVITCGEKVQLAYSHKNLVNTISLNDLNATAEQKIEMNDIVVQAKYLSLESIQVLVVTDRNNIQIYDAEFYLLIATSDFLKHFPPEIDKFAKGIVAFQDSIFIGTFEGSLLIATLSKGMQNLEFTHIVKAHDNMIQDLCILREKLVSIDITGVAIAWEKEDNIFKKSFHIISDITKNSCICLKAWKKLIIVGTARGKILIHCVTSDENLTIHKTFQVNAHARMITAMDVDENAALLCTVSEDSFIRVWKLSEDPVFITHGWSFQVPNSLLYGIHFLPESSLAAITYDKNKILTFRKS